MKLITLIFVVSVALLSVQADETKRALIDDIMRKASSADAIEIDDLSSEVTQKTGVEKDGQIVWTDAPKPVRHITLIAKSEIVRLLVNLQISSVDLIPVQEFVTEDGRRIWGRPPCLCSGDFQCRFVRDKKEVLLFTIYHEGVFLRMKRDDVTYEFDLIPPSGTQFHGELKELIKRANQKLVPTATATAHP